MIKKKHIDLLSLNLEKSIIDEIKSSLEIHEFKEGEIIINYGDIIKYVPIVLEGVLKVMKEDKDYGEGLLYYLKGGDTCSVSTSCLSGFKKSNVKAVCETEVKIILISASKMNEWMSKYESWRSFIINSYQKRYDELFNVINSISFDNLEERINNYIHKKSSLINSKKIITTHEEIAKELSTSRVVVSRILKLLENKSVVKLGRNYVEVL